MESFNHRIKPIGFSADADRAHQKEAGGRFLLRGVKFVCVFVLAAFVGDVVLHLDSGWRLTLLVALIAIVCYGAVQTSGQNVNSLYVSIANMMTNAAQAAGA